jgi:hypothetical protein
MSLLWALIPDEALILVIAAIGIGLILRIISGRTAVSLIGGIALMVLLAPFVEALFASLPWWLTLLLFAGLVLSVLRGLSSVVLGERASDHMVGTLASDVVRFCFVGFFQLLFMPFRLIGWLFRRNY